MKPYAYPDKKVLMIDDEAEILEGYMLSLPVQGINNIECCQDSREVMNILANGEIAMVVMDLSMPHINGQELIGMITENYPNLPIVVVTGTKDIDIAIQCIKRGVYDYIIKPVEINRLVSNIKRAVELNQLKDEVHTLGRQLITKQLVHPEAFANIKTHNESMKAIFKYIEAIAPSPKPLIITGESGVGKELIAQTVHALSQRHGEFVPVNVGGLDDTLFADTLFGHKRGAFTGADKDRDGLIKKAEGGTLFLDEIGEIEPKSQVKLLRLLQENQYYPLGSDSPITCNIRTIIATNVDLKAKQEKGEFRKDLYYRLMTHYVDIPPLRERYEDLPLLLDFFLEKAALQLKRVKPKITNNIYSLLHTYHFPGNIRELEAIIYNTLSISEEEKFSYQSLENYIRQHTSRSKDSFNKNEETKVINIITNNSKLPSLKDTEEFLLQRALEMANGNQSIAAPLVGLTPSSFCRRLQKITKEE